MENIFPRSLPDSTAPHRSDRVNHTGHRMARERWLACFAMVSIASTAWGPALAAPEISTDQLVRELAAQDVSQARILGVDRDGMPLVCGMTESRETLTLGVEIESQALLSDERAYELIPSVIRPDGVDGLFLEVNTNGPVNGVTIVLSAFFIGPGQIDGFDTTPVPLRDDGLEGDRVAGDFIFTGGPIRYNTAYSEDPFLFSDYPDGLAFVSLSTAVTQEGRLGGLEVEETDTSISPFAAGADVGLLRGDIPVVTIESLSPIVNVSPYLINVKTDVRGTQRSLRLRGLTLDQVTHAIYDVLPDTFDFLTFFSTNKIERLPFTSSANFITGIHSWSKIDYTGSRLSPIDNTAFWGSAGKLLGLNRLDMGPRGANTNIATHELLHQWNAFFDDELGVTNGGAHYSAESSVGSLIGGHLWQDNGDGSFSMVCDPLEGRGGAFAVAPLDEYMMGVIEGGLVPPARVYDSSLPSPGEMCDSGTTSFTDISTTVTIEDIQSVHGVRTPGPADAQREYRIGFVAESHERFLTPEEMTFYDTLAKTYTTPIPQGDEAPLLQYRGWTSIERYFGESTSWTTVPVPEPSSGLMLPSGVAFLGLLYRRRVRGLRLG